MLLLIAAVAFASTAAAQSDRTARKYGGLGATIKAFYAQNRHGRGRPPLGVAFYRVTARKHGRVTAFMVTTNFRPQPSARKRLTLTLGIYLPADATKTNINTNTCIVMHSKKLKKLIGMGYAAATASPHEVTARIHAEARPRC